MQPLIFIDAVSVISKFFINIQTNLQMIRLYPRFVVVVVKKSVNGKLSMAIE